MKSLYIESLSSFKALLITSSPGNKICLASLDLDNKMIFYTEINTIIYPEMGYAKLYYPGFYFSITNSDTFIKTNNPSLMKSYPNNIAMILSSDDSNACYNVYWTS